MELRENPINRLVPGQTDQGSSHIRHYFFQSYRMPNDNDIELWREITSVVSSGVVRTHHATRHNTPIHNILSTAPQLSVSQKALGTLPEDGNVMPKHVRATMHY
jgi:hypothetical protein